jgi:hypothetical protein
MAPKAELREFLKSRRDRLRPEDVGLPSGGRRRVPGSGARSSRCWRASATRNSGTKRYRHPVVGEMKIHFEAMRLADEDQLLFIYSVESGTALHDAMRLPATWAATQDAEAAHRSTRGVDDRASPIA